MEVSKWVPSGDAWGGGGMGEGGVSSMSPAPDSGCLVCRGRAQTEGLCPPGGG